MLRIAHVADIHMDEKRGDNGESLEDSVERLLWIGEDAHEAGAELLVVAGDTFHNSRTCVAERNAAVTVYRAWADMFPVVVVKGNNHHDGPGEIKFLGALKAKHGIHVFELPGEYVTPAGDVVACMPFPEKNWLAGQVDAKEDLDEVSRSALKTILLGFRERFNQHSGARVLLGHLEFGSARTDAGQPLVGRCFIELAEQDVLDTEADVCLLGHIHKHQILGDGRICYAGSTRQVTFGESNEHKGYCLVDVERGKPPVIEHRQAPGRQLMTIDSEWVGTVLDNLGEDSKEVNELWTEAGSLDNLKGVPEGAIVRLTYHVEESDKQQAAEQAERARQRLLEAGAKSVKLDPRVIPTYRVRSEQIREAHTNAERLEAWWETRGMRPERAEKVLEKLGDLECPV